MNPLMPNVQAPNQRLTAILAATGDRVAPALPTLLSESWTPAQLVQLLEAAKRSIAKAQQDLNTPVREDVDSASAEVGEKRRRKSKWQKASAQPIMRAAVWELRFGRSRIVETASRYGIPLRTLRRYRDISAAGGNGYETVDGKGVQFDDSGLPRRVPLPPRTVCKYRPGFTYWKFEEDIPNTPPGCPPRAPPLPNTEIDDTMSATAAAAAHAEKATAQAHLKAEAMSQERRRRKQQVQQIRQKQKEVLEDEKSAFAAIQQRLHHAQAQEYQRFQLMAMGYNPSYAAMAHLPPFAMPHVQAQGQFQQKTPPQFQTRPVMNQFQFPQPGQQQKQQQQQS